MNLNDYFLERELADRLFVGDERAEKLMVLRILDRAERDAGRPGLIKASRWSKLHYDVHFEQKMWV